MRRAGVCRSVFSASVSTSFNEFQAYQKILQDLAAVAPRYLLWRLSAENNPLLFSVHHRWNMPTPAVVLPSMWALFLWHWIYLVRYSCSQKCFSDPDVLIVQADLMFSGSLTVGACCFHNGAAADQKCIFINRQQYSKEDYMADRYQFNGWSDDLSEDSGSSAWNTRQLSYRTFKSDVSGQHYSGRGYRL